VQHHGVEGREELAREIVDAQLVDRGTDQFVEPRSRHAPRFGGGEPEAQRRRAHVQASSRMPVPKWWASSTTSRPN
jgi:hypothetical protein